MAAPRRYSDAQRQAMFRLFEAGRSPTEVAAMCAEGTAGVEAFTIPRRTAHDIVTALAARAERDLPTTIAEAGCGEAVERYPERIARIIDLEIARLEKRQKTKGLGVDDYTRLRAASDLSFDLHKRLAKRPVQSSRRPGAAQKGGGAQAPQEGAVERLAREEAEQAGAEDQPSQTYPPSTDADPAPEPPVRDISQSGDGQPPSPVPTDRKADPRETLRRIGEEHDVDLLGPMTRTKTPASQSPST